MKVFRQPVIECRLCLFSSFFALSLRGTKGNPVLFFNSLTTLCAYEFRRAAFFTYVVMIILLPIFLTLKWQN